MMNAARLARRHPGPGARRGRLSGRAWPTPASACRAARSPAPRAPDKPADPIIVHPDVRRMLLTMRAFTEGGARARRLDRHRDRSSPRASRPGGAPGGRRSRRAADAGDQGVPHRPRLRGGQPRACRSTAATATSARHGIEQLVRDCRITQIYEGTNGIQALDLVGRKLPAHMGALPAALLPSGAGVPRGGGGEPRAGRVRRAGRQGVRAAAARHRLAGARRPEEPRPGGRRGRPTTCTSSASPPRLSVGAHGEGGAGRSSAGAPAKTRRSTRPSSPPRASTCSACCPRHSALRRRHGRQGRARRHGLGDLPTRPSRGGSARNA